MKKTLAAFAAVVALIFAGCGKSGENVLRVGATPVPHAELLNLVKGDMAEKGITLRVVEFTDYVTPNMALMAGDIEANFFQTIPYLESNDEWKARLVPAFGVHVEPFGLYSQKFNGIDELPDGASISIPSDPANGGRALLLLQARGLITLRPDAGLLATRNDVVENPRGFVFRELEGAQLPRSLGDVDAATINGNFAMQAGLNPVEDSLIIESADSPYVNVMAVRRGDENDPRILALRDALLSEKVREFIERSYEGGVIAAF